ncbi:MAG: hypothetical protein HY321_10615 [Armatimonadetes bacterium]|nr:hypothetical protein [Armatimonadota bacterium]
MRKRAWVLAMAAVEREVLATGRYNGRWFVARGLLVKHGNPYREDGGG